MPKRLAAALGACLGLCAGFRDASAAAPVPFRFDELAKVARVGSFSLSPNGRWIAYAVSTADLEENLMRSAIWILPAEGGQARQMTAGEKTDSDPKFSPDGKSLAFLSNRDGGTNVWMLDLAGGEPRKATSFPTGVKAYKWSPDGKWFVITSDVFPECEETTCLDQKLKEREKANTKARIAERLLFRHWDSWKDGTRTHVWKVPAMGPGPSVDLTPGNRDAPPFGGDDDFQVSPDGKELVYSSNPDGLEALSTNRDLWLVPFDGKGKAVDLTAANKAFDGSPEFSPDGKWIAYRAQKRPGFEADLFRLMVYDRANGQSRPLTEGFDNWVEAFEWAPD